MEKKNLISRRNVIKTTALAATGLAMAGCNESACKKPGSGKLGFNNADFYDADGKFDVEKGKDAIIALMNYHGYPIFPDIREKLWVSDYGTGEFLKLGLGANMFINNEQDRYMLMDLFLLPGQMLPEHYHLKTEKNPSKLEGWLVPLWVPY